MSQTPQYHWNSGVHAALWCSCSSAVFMQLCGVHAALQCSCSSALFMQLCGVHAALRCMFMQLCGVHVALRCLCSSAVFMQLCGVHSKVCIFQKCFLYRWSGGFTRFFTRFLWRKPIWSPNFGPMFHEINKFCLDSVNGNMQGINNNQVLKIGSFLRPNFNQGLRRFDPLFL